MELPKMPISSHPENSFSLLVAGSTGAIGRELIVLAVASPQIYRIVGLSRRDIPVEQWDTTFPGINVQQAQEKLTIAAVCWEDVANNNASLAQVEDAWATEKAGDLDLSTASNPIPVRLRAHFAGHDIIVQAMGTTRKDAGSDAAFRRCDVDYTKAFINGAIKCNASAGQVLAGAVSGLAGMASSAPQQQADGGAGGIGAKAGGVFGTLASGVGSAVTEATSAVSTALTHVGGVGVKHFANVSASGADANSWFLYMKAKGEVDSFLQSHFSSEVVRSKAIYRPGALSRKDKQRGGEKFLACCCCCLDWMEVETVAEGILNNAVQQCINPPEVPAPLPSSSSDGSLKRRLPATYIYENAAIRKLASPA